jgi:hypothetical protein
MITEVLKHYKEIQGVEPDSELFPIKQDIDRALEQADLTDEERNIITTLFLTDHEVPIRQVNSGRPTHPWASSFIDGMDGKSENAKAILVSRRLKSAIEKIVEFLGDGYEEAETR